MARRHELLYRGDKADEFLLGVPARHLHSEEIRALDPQIRDELRAHVRADGGVYVRNKPKAARPKDAVPSDEPDDDGDEDDGDALDEDKLGEAADPNVAGQTDADQTSSGVSPDPTPPTKEDSQPVDDVIPAVVGETVTPGIVASDRPVSG